MADSTLLVLGFVVGSAALFSVTLAYVSIIAGDRRPKGTS